MWNQGMQQSGLSGHEILLQANGNLITDLDHDIVTIRYNLLNLTDTIQLRNGTISSTVMRLMIVSLTSITLHMNLS